MTPLAKALVRRIGLTGPLTIADYMLEALNHPQHGYYATRDPLGADGDFVTAPEVSQMFGELVGLVLAQAWVDQGKPDPFLLAELGPGRGTLMADILRTAGRVPGFRTAVRLHLVELSEPLRLAQIQTIDHPLTHHARLEDLPEGPLFLVANEFFDALPIRQFLRDGTAWRERVIGVKDGALAFGLTDPAPMAMLEPQLAVTEDGDLVQHSAAADAVASEIGRRVTASGGFAVIIDYGSKRVEGDTFQAVRAHQKVGALDTPGDADLTAHVNFGALATAASPAVVAGPCAQGLWLERLGITARAQMLARSLADEALRQHVAAHRRLTHPEEMGTLFQVMAIHPASHPPATGLFE